MIGNRLLGLLLLMCLVGLLACSTAAASNGAAVVPVPADTAPSLSGNPVLPRIEDTNPSFNSHELVILSSGLTPAEQQFQEVIGETLSKPGLILGRRYGDRNHPIVGQKDRLDYEIHNTAKLYGPFTYMLKRANKNHTVGVVEIYGRDGKKFPKKVTVTLDGQASSIIW